MGVGINKGAVCEHGADGRFITGINHGGSFNRVGHCEVVERHAVLTDGVMYVRMKAEVVRCKLADLVISDDCSGILKWMVRIIAINMVMATLDDRLRLAGWVFAVGFPRSLAGCRGIVQLVYFVEGSGCEMKEIV